MCNFEALRKVSISAIYQSIWLLLGLVPLTPWLHRDQMVPSRQFVDDIIAGCNIISAYIFANT